MINTADNNGGIEVGLSRKQQRSNSGWKKYSSYPTEVDPDQNDKSKNVRLFCMFQRPHMRAFHYSWVCLFVALMLGVSIRVLLTEIRESLSLTKAEIFRVTFMGTIGSFVSVVFVGPLCDVYGARRLWSTTLCAAAVTVGCIGLVSGLRGLSFVYFLVGLFTGGSFVICVYWTSTMFATDVVGAANGFAVGWGTLGLSLGRVIAMASFNSIMRFGNTKDAWRMACVVPGLLALIPGVSVYFCSDDTPKGNLSEVTAHARPGTSPSPPPLSMMCRSLRCGLSKCNAWLLSIPFAAIIGANGNIQLYARSILRDEFSYSSEAVAASTSSITWWNVVSIGLGGYLSDYWYRRNGHGMKGRLWTLISLMICQALFVLLFEFLEFSSSFLVLSILTLSSLCGQLAQGALFGIVPYVAVVEGRSSSSSSSSSFPSSSSCLGTVIALFTLFGNLIGAVVTIVAGPSPLIWGPLLIVCAMASTRVTIQGETRIFWGREGSEVRRQPSPPQQQQQPQQQPQQQQPQEEDANELQDTGMDA